MIDFKICFVVTGAVSNSKSVRFVEDGIIYTTTKPTITRMGKVVAKWKDGTYYEAVIIGAYSEGKKIHT